MSNENDVPLTEDELLDTIDFSTEDNEDPNTPVKDDSTHIDVGMEFTSQQEVYDAYNAYALKHGFGVRRRNAKANYILLTCSRNGFHNEVKSIDEVDGSLRGSSLSRIGCKAALHAYKVREPDIWRVTKVNDVHNHVMVSPRSVTLLRSHKSYSTAAKCLTESFSVAGVPIARVPHVLGTTSLSFGVRDCYNHMQKLRKIIYDVGDAQAVQLYCTQQHVDDPNFFYSIQFDDESRMMNFLWIDSRSRKAYEQFGDAITFDTTYRTNKYSMPFAPFVGINHHYQSVLFGCALLHDETEETFTWVFETWLSAMKGKKPKAIITDQDIAMGKAITKVFPEAKHRLCMWHIMKKFPEKLPHLCTENSNFNKEIKDIIYHSRSIEYFEVQWNIVIMKYHLIDNEWLKGLFDIRSSWIPIYNRSTFFAGMNTTQRSESINAFFNGFMHSRTTLQEFVVNYDSALKTRYESYRKEEFDSRHKERRLTLNMPIEEHAASLYTRNMFQKFHDQLSAMLKLSKEKMKKEDTRTFYRVWDGKVHYDDHIVVIDLVGTLSASCSCLEFEFMGILCRHILAIFHVKNIDKIPPNYIAQRWMKDGNKISFETGLRELQDDNNRCLMRYGLHVKSVRLEELAEKSYRVYRFIEDVMDTTIAAASKMVEQDNANTNSSHMEFDPTRASQEPPMTLKDPQISQTKGRKRIKSGIELSSKNKNICGKCGGRGHNRRGCKQTA